MSTREFYERELERTIRKALWPKEYPPRKREADKRHNEEKEDAET